MYKEKWDYVVRRAYQHSELKATYVIETTNGKELLFRPVQRLVTMSEPGDRILKPPYSENALLILLDGGDTIQYRIYSISCDDEVKEAYREFNR